MKERHPISIFCATACGVGFIPLAPGTCGTVMGVLLAWGLGFLPLPLEIVGILLFVGFSIVVSGRAEQTFQRHDDQRIVIDETAGMLVSVALLPKTGNLLLWGFLLFRLFDITKPFPARRWGDHLPGGLGIVMDDVAAGIYANLVLQGVRYFWG
ncbi:MAG: phosphatidylglycerophosphatase A [Deltaproteobacteria bacterium]|nr:MAG: phosphatidylglycerophosphatase A [Deltaproteobacteria bacterium]